MQNILIFIFVNVQFIVNNDTINNLFVRDAHENKKVVGGRLVFRQVLDFTASIDIFRHFTSICRVSHRKYLAIFSHK